jgi:hypothetical protein
VEASIITSYLDADEEMKVAEILDGEGLTELVDDAAQ